MDANNSPSGAPKPKASLFSRGPKPEKPPREPKKKRPRRAGLASLSGLLSFILIVAVLGAGGFIYIQAAERRPGPLAQDKVVILTREDDDGPLADQLERSGVIESAMIFGLMTLVDGQRSTLKRGEYEFKAGISMREVEDQLAKHRVVRHKLPIPEGLTSEQIVQRLKDSELLTGEVKETPREGSLLPDTYVFERGDSRSALIAHMTAAQTKMVNEIWQKRSGDLPIKSPGELVTLASIVEKETGKSDERPRVAGVFVNRLQKHMKLQSDPTIVYGIVFGKGTLGRPISKADISEPTPYNTYTIEGLPPGPICNPGRAAMEAVANPSHTKDLFFAADGTGGHAFSETYDQHQKNVVRLRQIEKDTKDRVSPDIAPPNIRGEAEEAEIGRYALAHAVMPARDSSAAFGALAFAPAVPPTPAVAALAARLAKVADIRRRMAALVGAGGSLSPEKLGGGKIDEIVVTGVNDPPPGSEDFAYDATPTGEVGYAPMKPAALAEMRARAARYGDGALAVTDAPAYAPVAAPAAQDTSPVIVSGMRARVFDASEGTRLDPLRNKSWDLSSAKTVPTAIR